MSDDYKDLLLNALGMLNFNNPTPELNKLPSNLNLYHDRVEITSNKIIGLVSEEELIKIREKYEKFKDVPYRVSGDVLRNKFYDDAPTLKEIIIMTIAIERGQL